MAYYPIFLTTLLSVALVVFPLAGTASGASRPPSGPRPSPQTIKPAFNNAARPSVKAGQPKAALKLQPRGMQPRGMQPMGVPQRLIRPAAVPKSIKPTSAFNKAANQQAKPGRKPKIFDNKQTFKLGEKGKLAPAFNKASGSGSGSGGKPRTAPAKGSSFKLAERGKLLPIFNKAAGAPTPQQPAKPPAGGNSNFKLGQGGKLTPIFNKAPNGND